MEHPEPLIERAATVISTRFDVPPERARAYAVKVLDAIDSRGGNPGDPELVLRVISVVVPVWVGAEP